MKDLNLVSQLFGLNVSKKEQTTFQTKLETEQSLWNN